MTSLQLTQVLRLLLIFATTANAAPPTVPPQHDNVPLVSDQESQPRLCQPTPTRRQADGLSPQQQQPPPQLSGCFLPPPDQQLPQETKIPAGSSSDAAAPSTTSEQVKFNTATSSPANTATTARDLKPSAPAATVGSETQSAGAGNNPSRSNVGNDRFGTTQFGTSGDTKPDSSANPISHFGEQPENNEQLFGGSSKSCLHHGQTCTLGSECCDGFSCKLDRFFNAFYCH